MPVPNLVVPRSRLLLRQRALQRAQLIKTPRKLVALRIVRAISHIFLGVFDVVSERLEVEILTAARAIGEYRQPARSHLGEAANDDHGLALALAYDRDDARPAA